VSSLLLVEDGGRSVVKEDAKEGVGVVGCEGKGRGGEVL